MGIGKKGKREKNVNNDSKSPAGEEKLSRKEAAENRKRMKSKITELLELPKEIVMNMPRITMIGNNDMIIENYKGIIEYEENRIRLNTGVGPVAITGTDLVIREITSEDVIVSGYIKSLEFFN